MIDSEGREPVQSALDESSAAEGRPVVPRSPAAMVSVPKSAALALALTAGRGRGHR